MVEFEINASFEKSDGYNFFLVQKYIGPNHYVPVYKSEIKTATGQNF